MIGQARDIKPSTLKEDGKQHKPEVSLLEGLDDALDFSQAEIYKCHGKEDDNNEYEFPHVEKIIPSAVTNCVFLPLVLRMCHMRK